MTSPSLLILIAGPYRSGTNNDPEKIAQNLHRLEEAALPLFRAGHLPMIGEWVALPIIRFSESRVIGDEVFAEIQDGAAARLIARCDAILRLPGESKGADNDVRLARERGIPVYYRLEDVPGCRSL